MDQSPRSSRTRRSIIWTSAILVLGALIYIGYGPEWTGSLSQPIRGFTGFGETIATRETTHHDGTVDIAQDPRRAKTLFDWLQILVIPAALALLGIWFNRRQNERQQSIEDQHTQDTTLKGYLDQMSQLLTEKDLHQEARAFGNRRITARAQTLTALGQLDGKRKRRIVQFLYEAQLINRDPVNLEGYEFYPRIVDLKGADLSDVDLSGVSLVNANLSGINFRSSNLQEADLSGTNLRESDFTDANLLRTRLNGADLTNAKGLSRAQITQAIGDEVTKLPNQNNIQPPAAWSERNN